MRLIKRIAIQFGFSVIKFSILMQFTTALVFGDQSCTHYYEPKINLKSKIRSTIPLKSDKSLDVESKLTELERSMKPFFEEVQKRWIEKIEKNSGGTSSKNGDDLELERLEGRLVEFETQFEQIFKQANLTELISAVERRFKKKWTDFEFEIYRNLLLVFLNYELKIINDSPMIDTLVKHYFNEYSINLTGFSPFIDHIRHLLRLRPQFLFMFSYKNLRKKARTPDIAISLYRNLLSIINVSIPNARAFANRRMSSQIFEQHYQRDVQKIMKISEFIRAEINESLSSSEEPLIQGQRLSQLFRVADTLQKNSGIELPFPSISSKNDQIFVYLKFKLSQLSLIVDSNDSKLRDRRVIYLTELASTLFFLTEYVSKDSKLTTEVKEKVVATAKEIWEKVELEIVDLADILVGIWQPHIFLLWQSWSPSSSFGFLDKTSYERLIELNKIANGKKRPDGI